MAATPGRRKRADNQRANQYFEPGVVGRKTGITIPQNARDEHGIEDLDGIFSSPEKPATQRRQEYGDTSLDSSRMELAHSSAPEPTEVLSTRRIQRNGKTILPPPLGRSPHKTNIGSSPRRQSSVKPRRQTDTPELLAPRPTVTRRLDFSTTGDATESSGSLLQQSPRRKSGRLPRRDVYELDDTEEADIVAAEDQTTYEPEESLQLVEDNDYGNEYIDLEPVNDALDLPPSSSPLKAQKRKSGGLRIDRDVYPEEGNAAEAEESASSPPVLQNQIRGKESARQATTARQDKRPARAKGTLVANQRPVEEDSLAEEPSYTEQSFEEPVRRQSGKGRKRKRKEYPTPPDTQPLADEALETTELDDSVLPVEPKKRGRPATNKLPVHQDTEPEYDDGELETEPAPTSKRTKTARKAPAKAPTKRSKAPKERDPNILGPPEFKKPDIPVKNYEDAMWAKSRNMSRLRDPTPSTEAMVGQTRSGRQVIKPLNHFANEKAKYGRDGTMLFVQKAEVLQQAAPVKRASSKSSSRAASKVRRSRMQDIEEEEDEEDIGQDEELELEEWELNAEVHHGEVNEWDPTTGSLTGDTFATELAWGVNSVGFRPVSKANFGFAKLLVMPYFGSGLMDMPVGGFKRPKNSGRTALHIFVHTGKVWVNIAGTNEITISAGGSFHVPRGNVYEIKNVSEVSARLFFAQGTEQIYGGDV